MDSFYNMAISIIGELPDSSLWIYDIVTIFLIIVTFCVFVIPTSLFLKKVIGG